MKIIEKQDGSQTIELSRDELSIIHQAFNEVLNGPSAIEEWEFHARFGAEKKQVFKLLEEISKALA